MSKSQTQNMYDLKQLMSNLIDHVGIVGWIRLHFKQGAELLRYLRRKRVLHKITDENKFRLHLGQINIRITTKFKSPTISRTNQKNIREQYRRTSQSKIAVKNQMGCPKFGFKKKTRKQTNKQITTLHLNYYNK